jgi:hypothetical protein
MFLVNGLLLFGAQLLLGVATEYPFMVQSNLPNPLIKVKNVLRRIELECLKLAKIRDLFLRTVKTHEQNYLQANSS